MDYKRVTLSYLFFGLGILLTGYQYMHLVKDGPLTPWTRQLVVIALNTLAVYTGVLLVHPEQTNTVIASHPGQPSVDLRRHYQRLVLVSMVFCFLTMTGIAVAIIRDDPHRLVPTSGPIDIATGEVPKQASSPSFSLANYFIASWYMIGYGILGLGTRFVRRVFNYLIKDSASGSTLIKKRPRRPERSQSQPTQGQTPPKRDE